MKALVKYAKGLNNLELRDIPIPEISNNEVLLKVSACGVCGTDLKIRNDSFPYSPPVVIGHEFSGEIMEVGSTVSKWIRGDRVVAEQHFGTCGFCEFCLTGRKQYCLSKRSPGYYSDGAFAEYISVPAALLHTVPESLSLKAAVLVEPMAIAAQAVYNKAGVNPGDDVVILGTGPISLLTLQLLKAAGAGRVFTTGLAADEALRFRYAELFGAEASIQVEKNNPAKTIMDYTKGRGVDLVIDLSGAPAAIISGFQMLKKDGKFCAIGLPEKPVELPWAELVLKAQSIYFSYSSGFQSWEQCLKLLAEGRIKTDGFLDNQYPLSEWKKAFNCAQEGKALKTIIIP